MEGEGTAIELDATYWLNKKQKNTEHEAKRPTTIIRC